MNDPRLRSRPSRTIGILLLAACTGVRTTADPSTRGQSVPTTASTHANPFRVALGDTSRKLGLHVRLSELDARAPATTSAPDVLPLADSEAEDLLLRLAGPAPEEARPTSVRLATRSLPAPRPGTTTRGSFPAETAAARRPDVLAPGPLRAVHFSPRGLIATSSQVSVMFSRAMVPLSTIQGPPPGVRLIPAPPGSWRWLDPFTLVFEAVGGFAKATHYTVEIPAGVLSADGEPLRDTIRWTFATPPPSVRDVVSTDAPDAKRPVVTIVFDQRVYAAEVLPFLRLVVDGDTLPLQPTTAAERAHPLVAARIGTDKPDRTVAVRPQESLPQIGGETEYEAVLHVLPGLPSAEGPDRTTTADTQAFKIRRGLHVVEHGCGRADACAQGVPWTIRFSDSLRPAPDSASWVRIEPALPGATVEVWNNHIVILGLPVAATTYTVRLASSIASWSGQELGIVPPLQFSIGPPEPAVWAPGGQLAILRADEPARYTILAQGTDSVRIAVRAVSPADWPAFVLRQDFRLMDTDAQPGRDLFKATLPVTPLHAGPGEAIVDLDDALKAAGGHVIVVIDQPSNARRPSAGAGTAPALGVWVQRTGTMLDIAEDIGALTVRATSVGDARPLEGVSLDLFGPLTGNGTPRLLSQGTTDAEGLARLIAAHAARGAWTLRATHEGGTTFFPVSKSLNDSHNRGWWEWRPHLRTHFLLDRPIYAPGDTVRFAGWLRRADGIGRELFLPGAGAVTRYTARGPRGESLAEDTIDVGPDGRMEASIVLPLEVNSGYGHIWLVFRDADGAELGGSLQFQIEEVRRPNFDVSLRLDPGPHTVGDQLEADVRARYFTGGGLPDAELNWTVRSSVAWYSPPGADDFGFGWVRWPGPNWVEPAAHDAKTNATGEHRLAIDVDSVYPPGPMHLTVEATVTDLDRQVRSASASVIVHPSDVYVGLRTPVRFVRAGEPLIVESLVVDLEGRRIEGRPVAVIALRQDRGFEDGELVIDESSRARCELRSREEPVPCRMSGLPAGDYIVVASVKDTRGRWNQSELAVRIAGETIPAGARAARDTITVLPDREEYQPGDTASVLVTTSFSAKEAVLTIRRAGVLDTRVVKLEKGQALVRLPVADAFVPNVQLHVAATAASGATATTTAEVRVVPRTRTLDVTVEPGSAEVVPGDETTVVVTVKDPEGRPVSGADLVLSAVDEALVALSSSPFRDPLADFYPRSSPAVFDYSLRTYLAPRVALLKNLASRGRRAATGVITGIVIEGVTGRPLTRAWVELPDERRGVWTGPDGTYRLEAVPAGTHRLVARAEGFVSGHVEDVAVRSGTVAHSHFLLLTPWTILAGGRGSIRGSAALQSRLALDAVVVSAAEPAEAMQSSSPPIDPFALTQAPAFSTALRKNFSPVAAFVVGARTGMDGKVALPIDVPHSLTRYRLRAVAVHGERRIGVGEATLTARLPLMVRPVPPRFLHQGDRFDMSVIVENRTGAPREAIVALRAGNAKLEGPAGRRVVVPAEDRVELRFPIVAGESGTARFQVAASAAVDGAPAGDAAEVVIPVLLPAVTETFAVYGQLDDARAVAFPVRLPVASLRGQGRVELGFSTTAAHELTDALWFLWSCDFGLPEVWASRILALSAIKSIPAAPPWSREAIDAQITRDVAQLARFQLQDGGWSVWAARFDADPFITVHVTHALQRASAIGLRVPKRTLAGARGWLLRLDEFVPVDSRGGPRAAPPFPVDYPIQARRAVQAYALDVRRRLGDDVSASAAAMLRDGGAAALPAEALAWLLAALAANPVHADDAADLRRELSARVVRSAGTAAVVSPYDAGGNLLFYSPRRTDAVVLAALVEDHFSPDLVAAMARGLMAHRVRGHWVNTQENAFAVAALERYLSAAEAVEPDMFARAWAGQRLAGERAFRGRSDERHEIVIPTDSLGSPGTPLDLVLAREGAGRLYYRVGLRYAAAGPTPAIDRGFQVMRTYEAIDDPRDVRRDEDGTWRVRLGARIRVRVKLANAGPRYHMAVVDPLPAGLEAINPALAGMDGLWSPPRAPAVPEPPAPSDPVMRYAPFHAQHINVKADRFEAFTTLLQPGRWEFSYLALATTSGDFAAPAPRAEEMYAPETFGRGESGRFVIEARATNSNRRE